MPYQFHVGQRWISESEPELGLGSVRAFSARTVTVVFGASDQTREYALDNAPLRRVRFQTGDTLKRRDDSTLIVQTVLDRNALTYYQGEGQEWCETELSDALSFSKPEARLLAGQVDSLEEFDLRMAALKHQHRRRQSEVRGFSGGRIDLIPHQLYIASEVASRLQPRVLLADEVGLGKTIEAGLILHRLIQTGRIERVLILLPESLIHQWFVELLRRFNLWFDIFDEERCDSEDTDSLNSNPFREHQRVIAGIGLFTQSAKRLEQALSAGWDMLVVDEAHHLKWSPDAVSSEYAVVEALGRRISGLLLLTATPEQLGMPSHFARLRLLDPDRFHDFAEFMKESEQYREVALLAELLAPRTDPGGGEAGASSFAFSEREVLKLAGTLGEPEKAIRAKLLKIGQGDSGVRCEWFEALLDRHGTGRVMFRNTRATIAGFPVRIPKLCPLVSSSENPALFDALAEEFAADTNSGGALSFQPDFSDDPRMDWLADSLRILDPQKVLLICRTQSKAVAIEAALRQRLSINMAVFHEGLALVHRDRNAAWFAEEDGARILLCSEIGSEGRNFQFAHHLVLFDLPLDPELLEQRIGRLDRIGQKAEIHVHVPFVIGSSQEVLARWFEEGLNSFARNLHGGRELLDLFGEQVRDLAQDFHETVPGSRLDLDRLLDRTQEARNEVAARLEQGRDRLLELNSHRPETARRIADQIRNLDEDKSLDGFMLSVFDHYSIHVEELSGRTFQLGSAGVFEDLFPGLPAGGLLATCDRSRALSRENIQFLTWDHPLATGALDLLLGSEKGNSCFARWPDPKTAALYLETIYVVQCIAPLPLHADRFLPPTPLRVCLDHFGNDVGNVITPDLLSRQSMPGDAHALLDRPEMREALLPKLIAKAESVALERVPGIVAQARQSMAAQLDHEILRLQELQKVNRSVRAEEIEALSAQKASLDRHLAQASLRLDALRLIQRGPV